MYISDIYLAIFTNTSYIEYNETFLNKKLHSS